MPTPAAPDISVVVPVYNEEGAAADLAREIAAAFRGRSFEIVFVDDASRDATRAVLTALKAELPELRVLFHHKNAGQSRAVRSGVMGALGKVVVTLDGDGQNDPADAPRLVDRLTSGGPRLGLVGGRRAKRQDSAAKRLASRFGNGVRKRLLNDQTDDTGCGLKVFYREGFLRLPYFDHIHRYLPALMLREGFQVTFEDVNHRHRTTGVSKYNNLGRAWVSISDLMGVMWLNARARNPESIGEA
jgi:glycosyltransferase involved in cell wall biosynthesis